MAPERGTLMQTVTDIGPRLGIAPTCEALGVARATYYRNRRPKAEPAVPTGDWR